MKFFILKIGSMVCKTSNDILKIIIGTKLYFNIEQFSMKNYPKLKL